jgi:hypothetical protein
MVIQGSDSSSFFNMWSILPIEIILIEGHFSDDIVTRLDLAEHVIEMQNNLLHISTESQHRVLAALVAANIAIRSLNPISQTL